MDKYNHWIAKVVLFLNKRRGWSNAAITIGQTSYYSCDQSLVSPSWHRHEDEHKKQWKHNGWIKFTFLYLWYSLRYGYYNNPLEVEAEDAAFYN
jgi:hypothetical protein